jgi:hypothetical protein
MEVEVDEEFADQSTFFLSDDPTDGGFEDPAGRMPQQSFIFGAEQFYGSSSRLKTKELFFSNTYKGGNNNNTSQQPFFSPAQDKDNDDDNDDDDNDEKEDAPPLIAQTLTTTKWGMVIRHWLLSSLFLPLYAVGLVTFTWRRTPDQLNLFQGSMVIGISVIFYGLLWTSLGLVAAYPNVRAIFPVQQACFVFFVYLMCCFAESMLKNTYVGSVIDDMSDDSETHHQAAGLSPAIVSGTEKSLHKSLTAMSGKRWSIISFLDTILFMSAPTKTKLQTVNILTLLFTFIYSGIVLALHVYFMIGAGDYSAAVIIYIIVETLLQGVLCFIILYPLSQVGIRLSVRDKVARLFSEATTTISGPWAQSGDHTFRLSTLQNVKAWQIIRDTLLRRYAFPTLYVDVVISAAFTLWVPLVVVGIMDFFFRAAITPLALNSIVLALLILGYLLICVVLASKVQETLSNTDVLRWQEYHFLVSTVTDAKKVEKISRLTHILKRLAQLVDEGKENAVVFQVWGFPLNRKMATFLGGVLVTLSSSVIVRAASKMAATF